MSMQGTVYLIHFKRPLGHARHYLGWAKDLDVRIRHHRNGSGARIMAAANSRGIEWEVVRTWEGDRHLEKSLKGRKDALSLCPHCQAEHREHERKIKVSWRKGRAA